MGRDDFTVLPSEEADLEGFAPAYRADEIFLEDIRYYINNFPSITLKRKGKTLGLGGFVPAWDGVFTGWNIVSQEARHYKTAVFKCIKRGFASILENMEKNGQNIRRIQSAVVLTRPEAVKLNLALGYRPEAVLRQYDRLGQDCLIMSKIYEKGGGL